MNILIIGTLIASFSSTLLGVSEMTQPEPIEAIIMRQAEEHGLDSRLVLSIVNCESQGNPGAINTTRNRNGSTDKGLLQINSIHNVGDLDLLNPIDNLNFGLKLMKEQGTVPWNSSKSCWS